MLMVGNGLLGRGECMRKGEIQALEVGHLRPGCETGYVGKPCRMNRWGLGYVYRPCGALARERTSGVGVICHVVTGDVAV